MTDKWKWDCPAQTQADGQGFDALCGLPLISHQQPAQLCPRTDAPGWGVGIGNAHQTQPSRCCRYMGWTPATVPVPAFRFQSQNPSLQSHLYLLSLNTHLDLLVTTGQACRSRLCESLGIYPLKDRLIPCLTPAAAALAW